MIKRLRTKPFLIALSCAVFLSGCTMIPKLEELASPVPDQYPNGPAYDPALQAEEGPLPSLDQIVWNEYYQDESLKELIDVGLQNNRDLKQAVLRIAESRAMYGIESSRLIPDLNGSGRFTRQKTDATGSVQGAGQASFIFQDYSVNLGVSSYEIDLFGRVRSLEAAALNEYLASQAAHRAVRISLIANIARAYISLRTNQALFELARETVETRQESFALIKRRAEEGVSTDLELAQAETLLLQARVDLYEFINAIAQDKNALRLLLGTPATMPDLKWQKTELHFAELISQVPVGLPSIVLTRRPDIMEAEHRLYSANANIGAARAAFFPRIALTATGGYSSAEISNLFNNTSQAWTFAPQITIPIFTGGRLSNNLELAEVRKNIAVVAYENKIETAFREVSDALSAAGTLGNRLRAQQDLVKATDRRAALSERRYEAGIENYLAVLDAKRELYDSQQNEIRIRQQKLINAVNLYKALGGGMKLEKNPQQEARYPDQSS